MSQIQNFNLNYELTTLICSILYVFLIRTGKATIYFELNEILMCIVPPRNLLKYCKWFYGGRQWLFFLKGVKSLTLML